MKSFLFVASFALVTAAAQAHFVFVVPDAKDSTKALVVFSDSLDVDENVTLKKVAGLKLKIKDAVGKISDIPFEQGDHSFKVTVPGSGSRIVFGSVDYGVIMKGESKPYLLKYHPKAIVGTIPADGGKLGEAAALEVVPDVVGGKVKFQMLARGKAAAEVQATILLPDGKKEKIKTDSAGYTSTFAAPGRYGVYAYQTEAKSGEHDGKKYDEIKHYATLVVEVATK